MSTTANPPPRRVQLENRVSVTVDAGIDDVWEVVRDVTRVGEWSHECVGAEWLDGATAATPGARFRGRNRAGVFRWGRTCEVVAAEPYELVWITVPTARYPDSSEWRISLAAAEGRTTITQQFRVLHAPKVLSVLYALMIPSHRDRTAELVDDLNRLGTVAGASSGVRALDAHPDSTGRLTGVVGHELLDHDTARRLGDPLRHPEV